MRRNAPFDAKTFSCLPTPIRVSPAFAVTIRPYAIKREDPTESLTVSGSTLLFSHTVYSLSIELFP